MVYLMLADGFEEVEAFTPLDYLRRAGVDIQTVGVTGPTVCGSHRIAVAADVALDAVHLQPGDMVVLPGGLKGTQNLEATKAVKKALLFCAEHGHIGAICAAPSILGHLGLLKGKKAGCYPGFEDQLIGAQVQFDPVTVDGNILTSRGAGTAQQFAFSLIEYLCGKEKASEIAEQVQWR